ncbi:Tyrosine-protein kinase transmembrane receptor ROR2 [Holothuria leucospilota]|uniref:Tyrosine-protein kinase transmembrane receptor ROR2 n=1 Tax=Holothuria leucospilota TaxID=206669 RepID=A0A9Q1BE27_HOLLE|nr:Tyrosine-protein kinase transmembrane receptor ROR2 [Holothuria leucospilota]
MSPIAQRVGLLDVLEVPVVIGNAVLEFHSFWERRRLQVEESCGESLYNSPGADVPVTEDQEDIPPFTGYRTFAKTVRTMYVLNNITQSILNHDYFCETSSPFSSPCWNGSHVSTSTVDHGSLIVASNAPPEILKEAKALKRLATKLRKVSTEGRDSFGPREDKSDPSSRLISEQDQAGGSFGLSRGITLTERMNNRTNVKPGDRVVLRCAIAGDPPAEYQWFKDDSLLEEETVRERIVIKTFGWGSKLIISRVDPSDSGYYRCNGRNTYGERSTTGLLVVRMRQCPHQWHRFGTSCYLMTSAMTFTSALQECTNAADNGYLVSIQSVEENEFITSFVEREKAWIGAWKTIDGLLYWLNG